MPRESAFEILEHTADVGLRARGKDLAETIENATHALAEIAGIWQPGDGEWTSIAVESGDAGGLLVDWLSEILYLHETKNAGIAGVEVTSVDERRADGSLVLVPLRQEPDEGVQVKAITYHQLKVERIEDGWIAEVYVDV